MNILFSVGWKLPQALLHILVTVQDGSVDRREFFLVHSPHKLSTLPPWLKSNRQGNEVRSCGQWQGAQDTDWESRGPAGIASDIRDAEVCGIARAMGWP